MWDGHLDRITLDKKGKNRKVFCFKSPGRTAHTPCTVSRWSHEGATTARGYCKYEKSGQAELATIKCESLPFLSQKKDCSFFFYFDYLQFNAV